MTARNGLLCTFGLALSCLSVGAAFAPTSGARKHVMPFEGVGGGTKRRLGGSCCEGGNTGAAASIRRARAAFNKPPMLSSIDNSSPEQESSSGALGGGGATDNGEDASPGKQGQLSAPAPVPVRRSIGEVSTLLSLLFEGGRDRTSPGGPPPLQVEDANVLLYDVFLLLNLSVSISFWVVHRLSFVHIGSAFSEGSLLCILWIVAGLANGAFLNSAVDGHYDPTRGGEEEEKAGPKAAGLLGLSTFVTTASLRVLVALVSAAVQHRPVGGIDGEMLMPTEIAAGLVMMSVWRALHSSYTSTTRM